MLDLVHQRRLALERDTAKYLGYQLRTEIESSSSGILPRLGLQGGRLVGVPNATQAFNAIASSLDLIRGDTVAMFDSEYSAVKRCWSEHAARQGAKVAILPVQLPTEMLDLRSRLDEIEPKPRYLIVSAVTSSSSIRMPLASLSEWCLDADVGLVVDAAHLVGHIGPLEGVEPLAVFGSLHKWIPVPRPAGFLWAADRIVDTIRPGTISLTFDADRLEERFSWWGTWDPSNHFVVPDAFEVFERWERDGDIARAAELTSKMSRRLEEVGLVPTTASDSLPNRMRSFLVPNVRSDALKSHLAACGVRAWIGGDTTAGCVLRGSLNVYNDDRDINRLITAVRYVVRGG